MPTRIQAVLILLLAASVPAADVVYTICGNGTASSTGDGGPASSATTNSPINIKKDASGNLIFTDYAGHRVRKIAPDGTISTIAGTGVAGFFGDGGPATAAQFNGPVDLAIDGSGNIYVSDQGNHRVRKIATNGTISTVAGNGGTVFNGENIDATTAAIYSPGPIALDNNGDLLVGSINYHRIRKVTFADGKINTIVGDGTGSFGGDTMAATAAQINAPSTMVVNAAGDLIFVDSNNARIRKVNASDGKINTIFGTGGYNYTGDTGPASAATFRFSSGPLIAGTLFLASDGSYYVGDSFNHAIRKIDTMGNINTIIGTGAAGFNGDGIDPLTTKLNVPLGIIADASGNVIFCDNANNRIRRLVLNPPAPTSVSPTATFISGGVTFETRAVKTGTQLTFTATGVDPSGIPLSYTWDFGDGTTQTGNPVTKTYFVSSGEQNFTVTVTGSHANGSVSSTLPIAIAAPASGGTPNIDQGKGAVTNPLNNIQQKLNSSDGGVLELDVSGTTAGRAASDVSTDFDGVLNRLATRPGFRPLKRFIDPGIVIATTTVTSGGSTALARKTLVIGNRELGMSAPSNPADNSIALKTIKGAFRFAKSAGSTVAKPDAVSFTGTIQLPAGIDPSKPQTAFVSIGNIADSVTVAAKGKATLPSAKGRLKKFQVKYPKLAKGTTTTAAGSSAQVTLTLADLNLSGTGFDTEGVTAPLKTSEAGQKSVPRSIQVAVLFGGVAYEAIMTVDFKLSPKEDSGKIQGRGSAH